MGEGSFGSPYSPLHFTPFFLHLPPILASLEVFLFDSFKSLLCFIWSIFHLFWGPSSQIKPPTTVNTGFSLSLLCLSPKLSKFSAQNLSKINLLSYTKPSMTCASPLATSHPFANVFCLVGFVSSLFSHVFFVSFYLFFSLFVFSLDLTSVVIYGVKV